jgi:hypothetical protein
MRKLDRTRDFGTLKGEPFIPANGDRVAAYTQDDRFFDVNDKEIVPGLSLAEARVQRRQSDQRRIDAAAEVLPELDKLKPDALKVVGKVLLGVKTCPSKTEDIIAAIRKLAGSKAGASLDEEAGKAPAAGKAQANGHKSLQSMIGAKPAPAAKVRPTPPPPQPKKNSTSVDLAAWARGQKEYGFHDIRQGIEGRLGVAVTDRAAALEALVDKGLVPFKEARTDLLPPAVGEVEDHQDA